MLTTVEQPDCFRISVAAIDLFVVPTIGFRLLYAFVIVRLFAGGDLIGWVIEPEIISLIQRWGLTKSYQTTAIYKAELVPIAA